MAGPIPNRKHKDSVFIDLFQTDETARQNFISLYNALHDTPLSPDASINPIRLDQVMYMAFSNDVSCLVEDKIIVLAEHQSTIGNEYADSRI